MRQVIQSLLDNDFYAFTMSNAIHEQGDDAIPVEYEFRNRTFSVPLATRLDLDLLEKRIEEIRALHWEQNDIDYLRSLGMFSEDWLTSLATYTLPPVEIGQDHGHLTLKYQGPWAQAIFWETPLLALINEMYYEQFSGYYLEGERRLQEKIEYVRELPSPLRFVEFGSRRRFSRTWQHFVTHMLKDEIPGHLLGTSNVGLARELDLRPVGTMAHQLFMVYTAAAFAQNSEDPIKTGAHQVLDMWRNAYQDRPELMTVLPDTYGTRTFLRKVDRDRMVGYLSARQDSGDPFQVGRVLLTLLAIAEKDLITRIVFSDGLDVRSMSMLNDEFASHVDVRFGWGTNLTNDLGYEPLSIVIKPSRSLIGGEWQPCVKLSDNPQKATGHPAAVARYRKAILESR